MSETAARNTTADSGAAPVKALTSALAGVDLSTSKEASSSERPMPKKVPGLTRRMSFTGRPIDIVREACSTQRNELVSLFNRCVCTAWEEHLFGAAPGYAGSHGM